MAPGLPVVHLRDDREIVHVTGTGVTETVLVSDGFDADNLIGRGKPCNGSLMNT
jgi:hypothetical protein